MPGLAASTQAASPLARARETRRAHLSLKASPSAMLPLPFSPRFFCEQVRVPLAYQNVPACFPQRRP